MSHIQILLVQARTRRDPMLYHEYQCITRRLEGSDVFIKTRNAVAERARAEWLGGVDAVIFRPNADRKIDPPLVTLEVGFQGRTKVKIGGKQAKKRFYKQVGGGPPAGGLGEIAGFGLEQHRAPFPAINQT